jgi:hypothetical protein
MIEQGDKDIQAGGNKVIQNKLPTIFKKHLFKGLENQNL